MQVPVCGWDLFLKIRYIGHSLGGAAGYKGHPLYLDTLPQFVGVCDERFDIHLP